MLNKLLLLATFGFALTGCQTKPEIVLGDAVVPSTTTGGGSAPAVALGPGGRNAIVWVASDSRGELRLFVSYNGATPVSIQDSLGAIQRNAEAPPQLAFDSAGTLYLAYVLTREGGKRFPESALRFVRSHDSGKTWSAPQIVTDDTDDFGSHNFHSMTVSPDGRLYLSWLDGRSGEQAVYLASSGDEGRTWSRNTQLSIGETCPCCRTALAAGRNGVVYAAWRAVLPGSERDIVIARSTDGGATFGQPVRVHEDKWVYSGCPHAGPSIQVDAVGTLHVLWWTGAPKRSGVFYTSSTDGGRTFAPAVTIDSQRVPTPTHVQLGVDGKNPIVVWDKIQPARAEIMLRASLDGGQSFGKPITLSQHSGSSMHPRLAIYNTVAVVGWVRTLDKSSEDHAHDGGSYHSERQTGEVVMRELRW